MCSGFREASSSILFVSSEHNGGLTAAPRRQATRGGGRFRRRLLHDSLASEAIQVELQSLLGQEESHKYDESLGAVEDDEEIPRPARAGQNGDEPKHPGEACGAKDGDIEVKERSGVFTVQFGLRSRSHEDIDRYYDKHDEVEGNGENQGNDESNDGRLEVIYPTAAQGSVGQNSIEHQFLCSEIDHYGHCSD